LPAIQNNRYATIGDLGIDLGSSNTLVFARRRGIILREPSVAAVDEQENILAIGREAGWMIGRTPPGIKILRPLQQGTIANFELTRKMLVYFLHKASRGRFNKPRVIVSVSLNTTGVGRGALLEALRQAGTRQSFLVEEPLAAALGAGLAVDEPRGRLVVSIGGGTTQIACIALGGVVRGKSIPSAGKALDHTIQAYLRQKYRLVVGEITAENLKITGGYAINPPPDLKLEARGTSLTTGLPRRQTVTAAEITSALTAPLEQVVRGIAAVLEETPPQLAADIAKGGLVLTGGGACLKHLDQYFTARLHLPVVIPNNPQDCACLGTGKMLSAAGSLTRLALVQF